MLLQLEASLSINWPGNCKPHGMEIIYKQIFPAKCFQKRLSLYFPWTNFHMVMLTVIDDM